MLSLYPLCFVVLSQTVFILEQPAAECLLPLKAVLSSDFPGVKADVEALEVLLADILIAKLGTAFLSFARRQYCIENVLWDTTIVHSADMAQPTETALPQ